MLHISPFGCIASVTSVDFVSSRAINVSDPKVVLPVHKEKTWETSKAYMWDRDAWNSLTVELDSGWGQGEVKYLQ